MERTTNPDPDGISGSALLAAYQLLIETTIEPGNDDVLLQRALTVLAAIPWPVPRRSFSAFATATDQVDLRLVAMSPGAAAPSPCPAAAPGSCLCGRALTRPGRLLFFDASTDAERAPCDPAGTGTHLILPLAARGRIPGVLHALVEPGRPSSAPELSFLVQVATLLGAELNRRREEREHNRLQMQFLQAQKMEAVGRLAGGVAHDFNNILTTITSYADLGLLKLPEDSPLRRNFNEILAAAERATLLTQQLLAFSRHQAHTPRVIDLNTVVAELGKTLRRLLGSKFELSLQTESEPARILADSALIEQLIINLLLIVRDAMPRGGTVGLSVAKTAPVAALWPGQPATSRVSCVSLALAVHGDPSRDALLALFRPGPTATEPASGEALGAAAVHDIVRECGGIEQPEPLADGGSIMRWSFPAATTEPEPVAVAGQLPSGSETILLVEDDDSVRVVMAEILRDLGYHLIEAREGQEALAVAAAHQGRIDALLTDVVLRGFGGSELWHRLALTRPGLRVLYVSDIASDHAPLSGAVSLSKPFSPWALALRLRQILDAQ